MTMAESQSSKRPRAAEPTVEDVLYFGRLIMEKDPFKDRAPHEEDRSFRALFGCAPNVVLTLWDKLVAFDLTPEGGAMKHLLWALMYAKQYGKWKTMRQLTSTDPKTLRNWIYKFFDAIALLEPFIVSSSILLKFE
jgi:hypothetical protein